MEAGSGSPVTARAKFPFSGTNNDELSFGKNDVIVITQQPEGGWWEGTHEGNTGWFPSAYVTVVTDREKLMRSRSVPNAVAQAPASGAPDFNRQNFRDQVLKSFLEGEQKYIDSMRLTIINVLTPIQNSKVLTPKDFDILTGNYHDIYNIQKTILQDVETDMKEDTSRQKIGGLFLQSAVDLKAALLKYSENHPRAAEVIKEKSQELEAVLSKNDMALNHLIVGLSEPIRHIDKYHIVMQELERIAPEGHADRGNLHRSAAVFKELKENCEVIRKQKEAQLEFLYLAKVEKVVPFSERGMILYVGVCSLKNGNNDPEDRFCALFTRYLMIFEITANMGYHVVEKLATNGILVKRTDGTEFFIEKNGTSLEITVATNAEAERWLGAFSRAEGVSISAVVLPRKPSFTSRDMSHFQPPEHSTPKARGIEESLSGSGLKFNHDLEMILPEGLMSPSDVTSRRTSSDRQSGVGRDSLRFNMLPPFSPTPREPKKGAVKMRKTAAKEEEDDFAVLRIVEGYCIESTGGDLNESHAPQLIVAEDEKILLEEVIGNEVVVQEKSIVDAVYSIKDQLALLQNEFQKLTKVVDAEQKARRRLEHLLPKMGISQDSSFNDLSTKP